ncbi:hypothetical protein DFH08DRAFT_858321 [Mycena albidolilacea]|uniref:MYND-type domain-containing protein n=1 Tax=Mycena albidolilacea TaxID=1033008 RepID=A0AAD7A8N1_9AGAR|nr:hypothetical protein DFH08DRAFT_858321 [Mycena albidolilacea]
MLACKSGRSLYDLQRVEQLVGGASEAQKTLYLPVFYICLDPAQIPTPDDLDSFQPDVATRIDCALLSLRVLFDLVVDEHFAEEVGPTLWAHVWPWIWFLHQHLEHISISDKTLVFHDIVYIRFFLFATQMYGPNSTRTIVSSTPGFRAILAKTWTLLARIKTTDMFQPFFWYLANLLGSLDFIDPVHFTEMIDGAGGTLDDLAHLVMGYLDCLIERQNSWEYGSLGAYLRCLMSLINDGRVANAPDLPSSRLSLHEQFIETLRHCGFVSAFVTATKFLLDPNKKLDSFLGSDTESRCARVLEFLGGLLNTPKGYQLFPDPIGAGLLTTMARITTRFTPKVYPSVRYLLKELLGAMVYYHVVMAVDEVLDEVEEVICNGDEFDEDREIFDEWDIFLTLARNRTNLMRRLDDFPSTNLKACDNLDCGKIRDRLQCRRCSGCRAFYYCNRECQLADWTCGGHRNHCGARTTLLLADSPLCSLGFRERQFMRALAQEAYEAELQFISEEQVMPMVSHYQVFTLFDFTCTPVEVTVLSVDESPLAKTLEDAGPEWTGLLARMRDSHGCMQVHIMQVCEGSKNRVWVIPLRSSSPYIHDALRDIANYFSEGTEFPTYEEVTVKVEPILDDIGDLVEIH